MSVSSTTHTSLTLSLNLAEGITATSYSISYSNTGTSCFSGSNTTAVDGTLTMYTLTGLKVGTEYSITVTATITGGGSQQDTITATTMAAG